VGLFTARLALSAVRRTSARIFTSFPLAFVAVPAGGVQTVAVSARWRLACVTHPIFPMVVGFLADRRRGCRTSSPCLPPLELAGRILAIETVTWSSQMMPHVARWVPRWRWRTIRGQTATEFVLLAGMLVGIAIALNGIIPPGLRQFFGRVVTSISGVAP